MKINHNNAGKKLYNLTNVQEDRAKEDDQIYVPKEAEQQIILIHPKTKLNVWGQKFVSPPTGQVLICYVRLINESKADTGIH